MIDGIHLLNEQLLQKGRVFIVTDSSLFSEVPVDSLYIDSVNNVLKIKREGGTDWEDIFSKGISIGDTPPSTPNENDLWLDTTAVS